MAVDLEKLKREAAKGSTVAQTIVGSQLLDGVDTDVDYATAFELLTKAADSGSPRAMFHLARMYADGLAVERDAEKATELFEAASAKGEFLAHIYLARAHLLTNQSRAAHYYGLAAELKGVLLESDEMREAVDFLASELNPERD
jgi:TPR repeat protein